jgi:FkbM family methyltransferase
MRSGLAYLDFKLNVFRFLKEIPIRPVRRRFLRSYYGRLRRHTQINIDEIYEALPGNPVIVDLGANNRLFVPDHIIAKAKEIHALEPDPAVFEALKSSVAMYQNVILYNAAIGSSDGTVSFYRQRDFDPADPVRNSIGASTFQTHQGINGDTPICVPQIGILTFLKAIGKHIDLMKVDIEGAEVPMLETLIESPLIDQISVMLVETHEHCIPELVERTDAIRQKARRLISAKIDMNWH